MGQDRSDNKVTVRGEDRWPYLLCSEIYLRISLRVLETSNYEPLEVRVPRSIILTVTNTYNCQRWLHRSFPPFWHDSKIILLLSSFPSRFCPFNLLLFVLFSFLWSALLQDQDLKRLSKYNISRNFLFYVAHDITEGNAICSKVYSWCLGNSVVMLQSSTNSISVRRQASLAFAKAVAISLHQPIWTQTQTPNVLFEMRPGSRLITYTQF
jgi:hypothetical protein